MKVNKRIAGAVIGIALLMGSLGIGIALAQGPTPTAPPQAASQEEASTDDQIQEPSYTGSISVDQAQYEGVSETDEAATLQGKATISAADAEAAAMTANPGATVVKTKLDNENGVLVYSVELSSGLDVKVDAGNGSVLHTEQGGEDNESAEADNDNAQEGVQEEHESQADDANEAPHAEDAPGQ